MVATAVDRDGRPIRTLLVVFRDADNGGYCALTIGGPRDKELIPFLDSVPKEKLGGFPEDFNIAYFRPFNWNIEEIPPNMKTGAVARPGIVILIPNDAPDPIDKADEMRAHLCSMSPYKDEIEKWISSSYGTELADTDSRLSDVVGVVPNPRFTSATGSTRDGCSLPGRPG